MCGERPRYLGAGRAGGGDKDGSGSHALATKKVQYLPQGDGSLDTHHARVATVVGLHKARHNVDGAHSAAVPVVHLEAGGVSRDDAVVLGGHRAGGDNDDKVSARDDGGGGETKVSGNGGINVDGPLHTLNLDNTTNVRGGLSSGRANHEKRLSAHNLRLGWRCPVPYPNEVTFDGS